MRNLFICFLLATLVALVQGGPTPVIEPATYLGVLVVFPVLGARLFRNHRLPPAVGAIAAGALLNQSGLLNATILEDVTPFKDAGFVWLGLFLGTQVARRPASRGPNAVSAVSVVVGCTLLVCLSTALITLTLLERLQVGLAAAVCAPIFTMLEPEKHQDEIGLTGTATVLALFLFGFTEIAPGLTLNTTLAGILLAGAAGLALSSELVYHSLRSAVTGPGRYLVYIILVGAVWQGSQTLEIHPALSGIVVGLGLGVRARKRQDLTGPLEEASSFVGPFALGFMASGINWGLLLEAPPQAWWTGALIIVPMVVGKALAGAAAGQLTRFGHQQWLTVYPLGVAAIELLPRAVPERLFLGTITHVETGVMPVILLGSVVLPMMACWVGRISGYVASRRNAAADSGGMELT